MIIKAAQEGISSLVTEKAGSKCQFCHFLAVRFGATSPILISIAIKWDKNSPTSESCCNNHI